MHESRGRGWGVCVTLPPEMSHIATRSLWGYSHVSILAFQRNQFSPVFSTSDIIHLLHTQNMYTCPQYVFKTSNSSIRAIIFMMKTLTFLKMTHFGVSDFTLSSFSNQCTDFDNVCIILMGNQCCVQCYNNLKITESIHTCDSFREVRSHIINLYIYKCMTLQLYQCLPPQKSDQIDLRFLVVGTGHISS